MARIDDLISGVIRGDSPPRIDAAVAAAMEGDDVDGALCQCEAATVALMLLDQADLSPRAWSDIGTLIGERFQNGCRGCGL